MAISYNGSERVFRLDTPRATYLIGIVEEGFLAHLYYGRRVPDDDMRYLLRALSPEDYVPYASSGAQVAFLNSLPMEYPCWGQGDFRQPCLRIETEEGYQGCGLLYVSHCIRGGKPELPGLPATYGGAEDCETLEIVCRDAALQLEVHLY